MGTYINKGNSAFSDIVSGEYVDKSGLIAEINDTLNTEYRFSCVTRCRRFGKSMAAKMLCAYYDKSCDSRELFKGLQIENDPSFEKYLNKYLVISIDITNFTTRYRNNPDVVKILQYDVRDELIEFYPDVKIDEKDDLMSALIKVKAATGQKANKFNADMDELRNWYDGYRIGNQVSIYNPYSVMKAARRHEYISYWTNTSAYDAVTTYVQMNFDGLKDDIIAMLAGERCYVNTTKFHNDMKIIRSKDDVLTVLIHLGYLSYDMDQKKCFIPNREVRMEMEQAVKKTDWSQITHPLGRHQLRSGKEDSRV